MCIHMYMYGHFAVLLEIWVKFRVEAWVVIFFGFAGI